MTVRVGAMIARKGDEVFTVRPDATVAQLVAHLQEHNVGALVVSHDGHDVAGIVSERDVVRRMADEGPRCLDRPVRDLMTTTVTTCAPDDSAEKLMAVMTAKRIRHVPVVVDGRLHGLVSIGDVVKSYIDELQVTADALRDYVTGSSY